MQASLQLLAPARGARVARVAVVSHMTFSSTPLRLVPCARGRLQCRARVKRGHRGCIQKPQRPPLEHSGPGWAPCMHSRLHCRNLKGMPWPGLAHSKCKHSAGNRPAGNGVVGMGRPVVGREDLQGTKTSLGSGVLDDTGRLEPVWWRRPRDPADGNIVALHGLKGKKLPSSVLRSW
jgi:hypothetical protein